MFLVTSQELTDSGKAEAPAMDVLIFLQRPVERIQTYQALLKVSVQFYFFFYKPVSESFIIIDCVKVTMPEILILYYP